MRYKQTNNSESGFTLVEIIVSTAIFVTVVGAMLGLFNTTLQINRRVQSLRELVQGSRAFTETLSREIRNGRIDYSSWASECDAPQYTKEMNQQLSVRTTDDALLCFYLDRDGILFLKKQTTAGTAESPVFDTTKFRIIPETFRFHVTPDTDPNPDCPNPGSCAYPEIQPSVTILAQFELRGVDTIPTVINYQSTISTDVYDILHED